jgi:hypothetical protein
MIGWEDAALAAPFLALGVSSLWVWGEMRRGERGLSYAVPEAWPFGAALWHGLVRLPLLGPALWLPGGALLLVRDLPEDDPLVAVVRIVDGTVGAAAFVLLLSIVFFNRPRSLVPLHLRDQPGAIAEWRGAPVKPTTDPPPLVWLRRRR